MGVRQGSNFNDEMHGNIPFGGAPKGRSFRNKRSVKTVSLVVFCLLLTSTVTAKPARYNNLLADCGFEKQLNKHGEPVGWHTRLTSIIPIARYNDPQQKKGRTGKYRFKDGCGYDWGSVRPWTMLVCPNCKHVNIGLEDSGDLYLNNHEYVKLVKRRRGNAVQLTLPEAVGNNEGVRVISHLIRAKRGIGYQISFEAKSQGAHLRVFVEGFRLMEKDDTAKAWIKTLPDESNPLNQRTRLKRVYRKQVNAGAPTTWTRFKDRFVAPRHYQFDYMFVTLYAYLPGKAWYDNVVLRKLTRAEQTQYLQQHPGPKNRRLR